MSPSVGAPAAGGSGSGGNGRDIDQPLNCDGGGWLSNANSNINPYIVFDDFVAEQSPFTAVQFYGGVSGGTQSFDALQEIGLEIWTIGGGGECGWTYSQPVFLDAFSVAELAPTFECRLHNAFVDAYELTANLHGVPQLVPGQRYMITIYGRLRDPNGQELFAWADSPMSHGHPGTSWNRTTQEYKRCRPDMAFRTLPFDPCQPRGSESGAYFSNYFSTRSPYLVFDDFTATSNGDLSTIQITGGVFDMDTLTGGDFDNIAGLVVEVHYIRADNSVPCDNWFNGLVTQFTAPLEETTPRYSHTDALGTAFYTFTIPVPPGVSLHEGERYLLGVFADQVDPSGPELFCWGKAGATYGYTSWSFDLSDGSQQCHGLDVAFCIDPAPRCPGDFNEDGVVDTRDVIAFLNAWAGDDLAADMDYNVKIDSRDVIAFLNLWNGPC